MSESIKVEEKDFISEEELISRSKENLANTVGIYTAMELAVDIHKGQLYGKEKPFIFPYLYHLDCVSKVILNALPAYYPHKTELLIGAWLHDSVEDHCDKISFEEIEYKFGSFVKELIYDVTDPKAEDGSNLPRKERATKLIKRLENKPFSLILKLADKIANVEFCVLMLSLKEPTLFDMYKKEFSLFKEALYNKEHDECILNMWDYLDNLINNPTEFF